jgi:hypothetical protein
MTNVERVRPVVTNLAKLTALTRAKWEQDKAEWMAFDDGIAPGLENGIPLTADQSTQLAIFNARDNDDRVNYNLLVTTANAVAAWGQNEDANEALKLPPIPYPSISDSVKALAQTSDLSLDLAEPAPSPVMPGTMAFPVPPAFVAVIGPNLAVDPVPGYYPALPGDTVPIGKIVAAPDNNNYVRMQQKLPFGAKQAWDGYHRMQSGT